jgi:hypothetical protein
LVQCSQLFCEHVSFCVENFEDRVGIHRGNIVCELCDKSACTSDAAISFHFLAIVPVYPRQPR